MVAQQFTKLRRAFEETSFAALPLLCGRRLVCLLVDSLTSHLGSLSATVACSCLVVGRPLRPSSDKGRCVARRKRLFESFIDSPLAAFCGLQFMFLVHRD